MIIIVTVICSLTPTFDNISGISLSLVLLVLVLRKLADPEETTGRLQVTDKISQKLHRR
jgi:hypothetical protein